MVKKNDFLPLLMKKDTLRVPAIVKSYFKKLKVMSDKARRKEKKKAAKQLSSKPAQRGRPRKQATATAPTTRRGPDLPRKQPTATSNTQILVRQKATAWKQAPFPSEKEKGQPQQQLNDDQPSNNVEIHRKRGRPKATVNDQQPSTSQKETSAARRKVKPPSLSIGSPARRNGLRPRELSKAPRSKD